MSKSSALSTSVLFIFDMQEINGVLFLIEVGGRDGYLQIREVTI